MSFMACKGAGPSLPALQKAGWDDQTCRPLTAFPISRHPCLTATSTAAARLALSPADPAVQRHPLQHEAARHHQHHRRKRGHRAGKQRRLCWRGVGMPQPGCRGQAGRSAGARCTLEQSYPCGAYHSALARCVPGCVSHPAPLLCRAQGSNFKPTKKPFQFETVLARPIRTIFTGGCWQVAAPAAHTCQGCRVSQLIAPASCPACLQSAHAVVGAQRAGRQLVLLPQKPSLRRHLRALPPPPRCDPQATMCRQRRSTPTSTH